MTGDRNDVSDESAVGSPHLLDSSAITQADFDAIKAKALA
jgi:hypothetical protein